MLGQAPAVFDAHDAIRRLGLSAARRAARTAAERVCVDAAAALRASRDRPRATLIGSVAATCLPHREIAPEREPWRRNLGGTVYMLRGGADARGAPIGVPYGAKARIILLHLIDGAIRGGSRAVEVQASMRSWMQAMGIAPGGMTYRHIGEQARRILGCRLQIAADGLPSSAPGAFVEGLAYATGEQEGGAFSTTPDPARFPARVALTQTFFAHVRAQPVPLDLAALRLIGDNSWALDLYIWLASVLPELTAPVQVSWETLFARIDFGEAPARKVRAKFIETWQLVQAIYPEAKLAVGHDGLLFEPSPGAAAPLGEIVS